MCVCVCVYTGGNWLSSIVNQRVARDQLSRRFRTCSLLLDLVIRVVTEVVGVGAVLLSEGDEMVGRRLAVHVSATPTQRFFHVLIADLARGG